MAYGTIGAPYEDQQSDNDPKVESKHESIEQTIQNQESLEEYEVPEKKRRTEKEPNDLHLPDVNRDIRARCKKCQKKTSFFCTTCDLPFCIIDVGNCFRSFHLANFPLVNVRKTSENDAKLPSTKD